jgi:hypothetical protein
MRPRAVACSGKISAAGLCCTEVMLVARSSSRLPDYATRTDLCVSLPSMYEDLVGILAGSKSRTRVGW